MKSKLEKLQERGFIAEDVVSKFKQISFEKQLELLKSKIASERTLGARLLSYHKTNTTVDYLIDALKVEEKLYSKIEICNSLVVMDELAISTLIACLGKIGNNQHKIAPKKEFLKDSYPLPRDIASRTLIRIGAKAFPKLLQELKSKDKYVLSELIDAIGHINFNSYSSTIFKPLQFCYQQNKTDDLIKFKIIRAFSGVIESDFFFKEIGLNC